MKAIVYTSNTGHTKAYAEMFAEKTGLPVYAIAEAEKELTKGTDIIYFGWLFATSVKEYKRAEKNFKISAVCGVGLCDTGCMLAEVRKAISLPDNIPLFTLQGGMDKTKLRGINKIMINMLIKMMTSKKEKTADDERMIELLLNDKDYVCEENLKAVLEWWYNQVDKHTFE